MVRWNRAPDLLLNNLQELRCDDRLCLTVRRLLVGTFCASIPGLVPTQSRLVSGVEAEKVADVVNRHGPCSPNLVVVACQRA
jgi:hypothetical protein